MSENKRKNKTNLKSTKNYVIKIKKALKPDIKVLLLNLY